MLNKIGAFAIAANFGFAAFSIPVEIPAFLTLPDDCRVTQAWEDGTKRAHCIGDYEYEYVFDADGQTHVNAAGVPLRLPGFWYAVKEG